MNTTTTRTLFSDGDLDSHLAGARRRAEQALSDYDADQLLLAPEADIVAFLTEVGTVEELVLHRDEAYQLDTQELTKSLPHQWDPGLFHSARRVTRTTVVVPFTGDAKLFGLRASTYTFNPPRAEIRAQEVHLIWDSDFGPNTAAVMRGHFNGEIEKIEKTLAFTNTDVAAHNRTIAAEMPGWVAARRAKHLTDKQLQADLGFPLKTRRDAASYAVPLTRRRLDPARPPQQRGQAFAPEPALADADYEDALRVLINSRNALERNPSTAAKLTEEGIRDLLLVGLNAQFEGRASGEVFNGAGKTDILIRVADRNVFIGECKIWHGVKKFTEAINQLLGYTTWRDTKAALLIFVKTGDVTAITEKAITALTEHPNFKRRGAHADEDRHDVVLHANGDPHREIKIALMLFLIPSNATSATPA